MERSSEEGQLCLPRQHRRHSAFEACASTAIGFVVSLAAAELLFPAIGITSTHGQNFSAICAFTVLSIIRSYAVRRLFNHYT